MGVFKSARIIAVSILSAVFLFLASGALVAAQTTAPDESGPNVTSETIQNGLCNGANVDLTLEPCDTSDNGAEKVTKAVQNFINTISLIVGIVAVVMIMVGGLRYITSGGSDTSVTSAKNTILYAIIGLVIVALSQVMVRFVLTKLG